MKIRMLGNSRGAPDHIHSQDYEAGKKYDVPEQLAEQFFRKGLAEEDKALEVPKETKKKASRKKK